jgi:hypothetical protein
MQVRTIQLINCCASLTRICHLDERKPAWLSRVTIGHEIYALDSSVSRKGGIEILLSGLVAEIADKYVGHEQNSFEIELSLSDCARTRHFREEEVRPEGNQQRSWIDEQRHPKCSGKT